MPERYLFRGSLLNRAATDKDFLARYAEEELTSGSKESGGKLLPEIRKRNKDGKDEEAEDERLGRNSLIDFSPSLLKVKNVFKNKICGDIFSSAPKSYDGVLYKSRITTSKETSEAVDTMTMDMDERRGSTVPPDMRRSLVDLASRDSSSASCLLSSFSSTDLPGATHRSSSFFRSTSLETIVAAVGRWATDPRRPPFCRVSSCCLKFCEPRTPLELPSSSSDPADEPRRPRSLMASGRVCAGAASGTSGAGAAFGRAAS